MSHQTRTQIRLPTELAEHIKNKARKNLRSFNSEMVVRLKESVTKDLKEAA